MKIYQNLKIDVEIANYIFSLMEEKLGVQHSRLVHSHRPTHTTKNTNVVYFKSKTLYVFPVCHDSFIFYILNYPFYFYTH